MLDFVAKKRVVLCLFLTSLSAAPVFAQQADDKGNWRRVEADNGAVYQIDMASIDRMSNGTATVVIYIVEGNAFNPRNMRRLWFDCEGRYRDTTEPRLSQTLYAPARSVIGQISQIACGPSKGPNDNGFSRTQSKPEPTRSANESAPSRNYKLELRATGGRFPNIVGYTDLPDGTKLLVSISKPRLPNATELISRGLPGCENDCIPASGPKGETLGVSTLTLAGAFSAGPFSWNGKPFRSGNYEVEIFLYSLPGEDILRLENLDKLSERMAKPVLKSFVQVVTEN